ncbi:transposase, YhgA-like family protein [Orientia tsutsugamushi str. Kato PP]|nr:transposase, YhgA-like family protein [Orientia tsutsugamushi str. Kato PP]
MTKQLKHDSLAKTIMSDPVAAQEFLEYYLPTDFKSLIDLSQIKVEQESYIEESLKKKYRISSIELPPKNMAMLLFIY